MRNLDHIPNPQFVFGSLFVLANRVDTLLERVLQKYNISSKQWFLSICVASLFENDPSLKELAKESGTSHQNVKQVALKLQDKNLFELYKDPKDARTTRVKLTKNSNDFWMSTDEDSQEFMSNLFNNINEEELIVVRNVFTKLSENLLEMESKK
jgi:MarR family transcriptional regulator, transcriptional regulator for hemolysin